MSSKILLIKNFLNRIPPQCRSYTNDLLSNQNFRSGRGGNLAPMSVRCFGASRENAHVEITKSSSKQHEEKVLISSCGTIPAEDDDDEDEEEEMFVEPHVSLGTTFVEWGGPRRGGRLAEPTRYGDWERKGRCSDF